AIKTAKGAEAIDLLLQTEKLDLALNDGNLAFAQIRFELAQGFLAVSQALVVGWRKRSWRLGAVIAARRSWRCAVHHGRSALFGGPGGVPFCHCFPRPCRARRAKVSYTQ